MLRECKLTPTEVDCIECHGTGTPGGPEVERAAFFIVFFMVLEGLSWIFTEGFGRSNRSWLLQEGLGLDFELTPLELAGDERHATLRAASDHAARHGLESGEISGFGMLGAWCPAHVRSSKSNIAHGEGGLAPLRGSIFQWQVLAWRASSSAAYRPCSSEPHSEWTFQVSNCEGAANVHLKVRNPHLDMEAQCG